MREYLVHWTASRTYDHPYPERTARVGRIPGEGDHLAYKVWPSVEALERAYYAHGPKCTASPHQCVKPVVSFPRAK